MLFIVTQKAKKEIFEWLNKWFNQTNDLYTELTEVWTVLT